MIAWMKNTLGTREFEEAARHCTVNGEHMSPVNAVRAGHITAAVLLLEAGGSWDTALACAAVTGKTELFDAALPQGKLPILEEKYWTNSACNSFLALSAESCPLNTVQWLLAHAPFPEVDETKLAKLVSDLMTSAALNPDAEVLRAVADALLAAFPSLTPPDVYACVCNRGSTPLFYAARAHNLRSVELILAGSGPRAAAAVATAPEDCTPLAAVSGADAFIPCAADSVAVARALLAHVPAAELAAYLTRVPASGAPALQRAASQANTALVSLLLRELHEAAGAGATAEAATSALFETSYNEDFAAPGSAADVATRRTVDALLTAAVGLPLARCAADAAALARLRGLIMKRDDASDGEVAHRCLTLFSSVDGRLPRCVLELLLALVLPAAAATMHTHMPLWRRAVKTIVTRQRLWNRRGAALVNEPVLSADAREWRVSFEDSLDTRDFYEASCRCIAYPPPTTTPAEADAPVVGTGYGPLVGELTVTPFCDAFPAVTAFSGPDGTCAVCRSCDPACVPHCAALRDAVDVADARLLAAIIAAAPAGIYTPPADDEDCPFYPGSPELAPRPVREALLQSMPGVFGTPEALLHLACATLKPSVAWALICGGVDPAAEYTAPGTRGAPLPALHSAVSMQMGREPDEPWLGKTHARAAACLRVLQHGIASQEASAAPAAAAPGAAWKSMLLKPQSQGATPLTMAAVTANANVVRICLEEPEVTEAVGKGDLGHLFSRWPYTGGNADAGACVRATAALLAPAVQANLLRGASGDASQADAAWAALLSDPGLVAGAVKVSLSVPKSYASLAVLLGLGAPVHGGGGGGATVLHTLAAQPAEASALRAVLAAARDGTERREQLQALLPAAAQMGDDNDEGSD